MIQAAGGQAGTLTGRLTSLARQTVSHDSVMKRFQSICLPVCVDCLSSCSF